MIVVIDLIFFIFYRYIDETLSPNWDETLVFDDVVFYAPIDELQENPPLTVVEVYDYDTVVRFYFVYVLRFS